MLWLLLDRLCPELLGDARSLLHFAPEPGLEEHLRRRVTGYASADVAPGVADLTLDITAIDLPDGSFDGIICSHVLEHVPDDAQAMRELRRVLVAGGWAIVMVPIDHGREATLEDPSITDPDVRREMFWQEDHVRLYACDIVDRLTQAGFRVEHLRPADSLSDAEVERYRLGGGSDVFVCWADD